MVILLIYENGWDDYDNRDTMIGMIMISMPSMVIGWIMMMIYE